MRKYDTIQCLCEIEFEGERLVVDTTLLGSFDFQIGRPLQFIGEVQAVTVGAQALPCAVGPVIACAIPCTRPTVP